MFKQLPNIYVDSCKHTPMPPVGIPSIYATNNSNVQNEHVKNTEIYS